MRGAGALEGARLVESNESDEDRRERYLERVKDLDLIEQKAAHRFDQAMLTLSGGALFLSVAYGKQAFPNPGKCSLILLVIAWLGFAAALCLMVTSYLATVRDCRYQRELAERDYNRARPQVDVPNWGHAIDPLNLGAWIGFLVGVVFFVLYGIANLF